MDLVNMFFNFSLYGVDGWVPFRSTLINDKLAVSTLLHVGDVAIRRLKDILSCLN